MKKCMFPEEKKKKNLITFCELKQVLDQGEYGSSPTNPSPEV